MVGLQLSAAWIMLSTLTFPLARAADVYNKGDINVYMSDATARALQSFIPDEEGDCEVTGPDGLTNNVKRADNAIACLLPDTRDIFYNIEQGNIFQGIPLDAAVMLAGPNGLHVPVFQDQAIQQAMGEVILAAGNIVPAILNGVKEDHVTAIALLSFFSVIGSVLYGVGSLANFVIDHSHLVVGKELSLCPFSDNNLPQCDSVLCNGRDKHCTLPHFFSMCKCQDYRCPTDDDDFPCPDECGGNDGTDHCKGLSDGKWKGCPLQTFDYDDGSSDPNPHCNGHKTSTWVHRSAGAAAIDSFCAQIGNLGGKPGQINDQQYNVGTVDDLHLTVEFPMGGSTTVFPGDCKQYFYAILDGCDGDDPNTPLNKHGGSYVLSSGPILTLKPVAGDPVLMCNPPDPPLTDGYKVAMRRDGLASSISDFCQANNGKDIGDGILKEYGPFGPPSAGGGLGRQSIRLHINRPGVQTADCQDWDGKVNQDTCMAAFMALTDDCNTDTQIGKRGGSTGFECATWRIEGSGGADEYRMHLHQKMVDDYSWLEWTVYDSRGTLVGGPSTDPHPAGTPYKVGFWVDSPTKRDATNIRMSYPDKAINIGWGGLQYKWSTGWTGKRDSQSYLASYFCDDVLDQNGPARWQSWENPGAPGRWGFHRELDCYFRGWANADGIAGDPPLS